MPRPVPVRPAAAAAGVAALSALAALGATGVAAGAASTPAKTAQSEYQAALKAVGNQSVHVLSVVTQGKDSLHLSADAGATSGKETLTINNGKGPERMSTEVVGSTGYLNGNSTALQYVIGLTAAQSRKYAGKWLSFPTSNTGLAQLVNGLLKSQVANEVGIDGPFTFGTGATVNGQHATAIKGSVSTGNGGKATEILYVPSTGTPLPIQEVTNPGASAKSSLHGTVTFSNWGEKVSVKAPAHSTSILTLAPPSSSGATTTTGG